MAITAKMVSELRERSGAGMMDCKKALEATGGDLEAAVDHLRKQGMQRADKKADRAMGEGRVYAEIAGDGRSGALVSVSCETDFVAKTEQFTGFLSALASHVLANAPASKEALLEQVWSGGGTVGDALKGLIGSLGENMQLVDAARLECADGYVGTYVHHDNQQAAMVAVKTGAEREAAQAHLKSVCQHIVVQNPAALTRDEVDPTEIEREKDVYRAQIEGKPAEMQEKILAGKLGKYYSTVVLPEQAWILDDKQSVAKALEGALGAGSTITAFARFRIGG